MKTLLFFNDESLTLDVTILGSSISISSFINFDSIKLMIEKKSRNDNEITRNLF